jgi:hypothetical protein
MQDLFPCAFLNYIQVVFFITKLALIKWKNLNL